MSIHVGCSGLPAKREKYFESLNAVEVLPSQEVPPTPTSARRWAEEAPPGFVFTLVASRLLVVAPDHLPPGIEGDLARFGGLQLTDENLALHARTLDAAVALGARVLLFSTPSQIGPSRRGREALRRFFGTVDRRGIRFAWEPHGPWGEAELGQLCAELDLVRCVDPLRDALPPGPAAYVRLGPFAIMGRSIADDELERIVEALAPFDESFCFFSTERAFGDAKRLREMSQP
jgi:uncharacterized protein YecE (DUF72 family)